MIFVYLISGLISRTILADNRTILRENKNASLRCPQGEISIKKITSQKGSCGSNLCESQLLDKIKAQCDSLPYCKLESELLGHCRRLPIYLDVFYKCSEGYPRQNRKGICSDKLNNIWCHSNNDTIEIDKVSLDYKNIKERNCVKGRVKLLCEGIQICINETQLSSCLFEEKCVKVHYTCKVLKTTTQHDKPDTDDTGAIAAGSIGALILVVAAAIIVVCFIRKRVSKNSSDKKHIPVADHTTQREAFTGSQDIRIPYANQIAPDIFVYSVAKDTCRGVIAKENGGHGHFGFEKENRPTGGISDGRDYEYAMPLNEAYHNAEGLMQTPSGENVYSHSSEGIYDQISNQEQSEEAIYNHSVDGLYDTTASTCMKRDNNSDIVYSHSLDGIYDTTSDAKQRSKNDSLYSHSVDVSYDKLRQTETLKDVADT